MKKIYLLKGLDCPNCAAKIEKEVGALNEITSARIDLISQTLTVTVDESDSEKIKPLIEKIVHSHEKDVAVFERSEASHSHVHHDCHCAEHSHCHGHEHSHEHSHGHAHEHSHETNNTMLRLTVGGAIFLVGIILGFALNSIPIVSLSLMIVSYVILGYDVIFSALRNIVRGRVFDENFLMSLSTVGAFILGEYHEAVAVMLFYQIGEYFQSLAVRRSRRSISELMDIRPDSASVIRGGETVILSPEKVNIGETVLVRPGERVPLDGVITEGASSLDVKALTGESLPTDVKEGDAILSGSVNLSGVLSVRVTKSFGDSTASRIIELVENASAKKAKTENFISSFARIYTPAVVILALLLAIFPPLALNGDPAEWIRRALVFLVISCPCALVISIPLSFFGGIGAASRHGILVKGGSCLEALAKLDTVIFDKTGTLTRGSFTVSGLYPTDGHTESELLELAAVSESFSSHPIALSIISAYGKVTQSSRLSNYRDRAGLGIEAELDGEQLLVGRRELLLEHDIEISQTDVVGTSVHVARGGRYVGYILITDEIKSESEAAINELSRFGISKIAMLTGDDRKTAEAIAERLGIKDVHAELLPHQKLELLESELSQKRSGKLAFVGDGINDAPALARADIGIAMGGIGSDAAIEAADVVLMTDDPRGVPEAVRLARAARKIVIQNIVFTLTVKAVFLILGAFGLAGMWEAVFGDVGVALLAVLNAMRTLKK